MTTLYKVTWAIDLDADSPREAAEMALEIQRDPESLAVVFAVSAPGPEQAEVVDLLGELED